MQSHESLSLTEVFDSFLRDEIWNSEEHQAANDWLSKATDPSNYEAALPWALFEACKQAKEFQLCGILSHEEFIAEKEWIYAIHSDPNLTDDVKKVFQHTRLHRIAKLTAKYNEDLLSDSIHAQENLKLRKKKLRTNLVLQIFCFCNS